MFLKLHSPRAPLCNFVEHIVYYNGYSPPHTKERLLPDGHVDLIIDLSNAPKNVYDNTDHEKKVGYRRGWVSGVRREFITIDASYESTMIVVRFKPGRALPFFGFPISELVDQVVELECLWGSRFLSLREQIIDAETPEARISVLEEHLLRLSRGRLELHPSVDYAVNLIKDGRPALPIAAIRDRLGFSHKHLIALFGKHVGIAPKYFSSLMQFQRVLESLEAEQEFSWTRLAQDCGYFDQAHFINEFKRFSGLTPVTYLDEKGEYLNYIPVL